MRRPNSFALRRHPDTFRSIEDGSMTAFGLILFLSMLMIAGAAIDMANLVAARTQLMSMTDVVAHAALYKRDNLSAADAKAAALQVAGKVMPSKTYGIVLTSDDIQFGRWDQKKAVFTKDNDSRTAVLVIGSRLATKRNAVTAYLFGLIGFPKFDVRTAAVYTTFRPACFREGFVADGVVDLQSNNGFYNGFCVHSNAHVEINQNNTFEAGTIVSMPNDADLVLPQSGYTKNPGLAAALREGYYRMRIIDGLADLITSANTYGTKDTPSYVAGSNPVVLNASLKKVSPSDFLPGRLHTKTCSGANGTLTLQAGTYSRIALVTNCVLKFDNGAAFEDALVATTSTDDTSITAPNGLRLGKKDNCLAGGGAVIMTLGGVSVASGLEMYGSQILAKKSVSFAALANGIQGASIVSGGRIDGTSNMAMGYCGVGMEAAYEANYFRMAQ